MRLSEILEAYPFNLDRKMVPESFRAENYLKLLLLTEDVEKEATELSERLTDDDKKDVFKALRKRYNLPDHLTVHEAAEILGISPQLVRRYCEEGRLTGEPLLAGSGKWRIQTYQLVGGLHWREFLLKCKRLKAQSIKLANKMVELIDDLDYE